MSRVKYILHSSFQIVFRQHIIIERFQFWQSQILHGVLYFLMSSARRISSSCSNIPLKSESMILQNKKR